MLSSGSGRVDLGGNDPGERSPGSGEVSDEDTDESDEDFLRGLVSLGSGDTDDGDDQLREGHSSGSVEKEESSSETAVRREV